MDRSQILVTGLERMITFDFDDASDRSNLLCLRTACVLGPLQTVQSLLTE
jgi:hypothetical protein